MGIGISSILYSAADLMLPDICAVCGRPVSLIRSKADPRVPLCADCAEKAEAAVFSNAYPDIRRCSTCGYPLTSDRCSCSRCRSRSWGFKSSTSLYLYRGIGKALVRSYKFGGSRALAFFFARQIHDAFPDYLLSRTVVPVPFRPAAKRKRGWDPVQSITAELALRFGASVVPCLKRLNGQPQKIMNYEERFLNLENRIIIRRGESSPQNVLLIDDVFTTGATMNSCADILLKNGAAEVYCIALALDL